MKKKTLITILLFVNFVMCYSQEKKLSFLSCGSCINFATEEFICNSYSNELNKEGIWFESAEKNQSVIGSYTNGKKSGLWFRFDTNNGVLSRIELYKEGIKSLSINTEHSLYMNNKDSIILSNDSAIYDCLSFSNDTVYFDNNYTIVGLPGCLTSFNVFFQNGVSISLGDLTDDYSHEMFFYMFDENQRQLIFRFESVGFVNVEKKEAKVNYRLKNLHSVKNEVYDGKQYSYFYRNDSLINETFLNYKKGVLNGESIIMHKTEYISINYDEGVILNKKEITKIHPDIDLPKQFYFHPLFFRFRTGYMDAIYKE